MLGRKASEGLGNEKTKKAFYAFLVFSSSSGIFWVFFLFRICTIFDREENKDEESAGEGRQTCKLRALETEGQTAIVTAEEFQKETKQ